MGEAYEREVEFAVGFTGGHWREVSIIVQEDPDCALDDDEVVAKALITLEQIDFSPEIVAFHHILYIQDPDSIHDEDIQ